MYLKLNGITEREILQEKNLTKWDNAIADAERGIDRLKRAIETCREMKAAGEAWPGSIPSSHQPNNA
jgi:hypothetical protein